MSNFSLLRGRTMRATRLDGCGNPVLGPDSVVVTDGFITAALTSNTEAGETISVTNAAGRVCISDVPTPKFVNYSAELTFCGVKPELFEMLTGQPLVLNAAGTDAVGFRQNSKIDVEGVGFALELWTGVASTVCSTSGNTSYGYILLPFLKGGVLGDLTVENGAINFAVTGSQTRDGAGWGVGPFNVTRNSTNAAAPLKTAISSGDHLHLELVTVAPPVVDDTDDIVALGVPATGATAGTPGTWTPANSYAPKNLTEIQAGAGGAHGVAVTASPNTAWTTGQHVVLRDKSLTHWTGTAWAAGAKA